MQDDRRSARGKRDDGIALMLAILLLVAASTLAISTLQTVASDGRVAGFQNQEAIAFYAAEAGVADARAVVRNMGERSEVPSYPADFPDEANPAELSASAEFVIGERPLYYADPNSSAGAPIVYVGEGAPCTEGCNMTLGGIKFNHTKWQVNVVGESPSGDQKRLEVVATRLLPVGY